jgi:hypothetical protein
MLTAIAETAPGGPREVREPLSSTLDLLALVALVRLLAGEPAEAQPPFAMDNEAELSTAVVTAPHDTTRTWRARGRSVREPMLADGKVRHASRPRDR